MATPAEALETPGVPLDTFAARLAVIESERRWNHKQAATACGFDPESWRGWTRGRQPQKLHEVAQQIADATGYSYQWILMGGPLRSRWLSPLSLVPDMEGQMELALDGPRVLVTIS